MSFRRNVRASYLSQLYVTGVGLLMVPIYLRYLGPEAYGLVGIFTMLQAWFQLLDLGLSPTLAREVARYRGGVLSSQQLRMLVRALEVFFYVTALLAAIALTSLSGPIAQGWLKVRELSIEQVQQAIAMMALAIPLRWISGLYRAAINGFEHQILLAVLNTALATFRFVGVVAVLHWVSATPKAFFLYQLVVALIEVAGLYLLVHHMLPRPEVAPPDQVPATWRGTLSILRFSVSVSITGGIWIVLTQADKLLLSKILPLADYGYVTLAVAVANGVNIVSTPLGQALMPRLARLTAAGDEVGVIQLYRRSTHMIALLVSTVGAILAFSAGSILHGWTGNPQAAAQAASPLIWYALGNVSLGFAAFPYYLQFARGQLRLHIIGNLLLVSAMLPAVWWAAHEYGGSGGGMAWCITITLYLLIWVSHSHRQLLPGMALQWLVGDVLKIAIPIFATAWLVSHLAQPWIDGTRIHAIIVVALCSAGTLAAAAVMHKIVKT